MSEQRNTHRNPEMARTGWSDDETRSLVQLYFHILALEKAGKLGRAKGQTTKRSLVTGWREAHAPQRSHGSVEMKLMNISASCEALGLDRVQGYKPMARRSKALDEMVARLAGLAPLLALMALIAA
tara:strand:- start:831 stop:1208 length:378 start_codon:yes stop_codon:yes gene_type:complete